MKKRDEKHESESLEFGLDGVRLKLNGKALAIIALAIAALLHAAARGC